MTPLMSSAPGTPSESPESWFHRRATYYVESQILFELNQAGVLALLCDGIGRTAAEIAALLKLEPGPTDALLDYVFAVDQLLERDSDGRYSLSEFGNRVMDRFSDGKCGGRSRSINMFDVRVGAYGPVWQNLGGMLAGTRRYGTDFQRAGRYAEKGVSKLAVSFWKSLVEHIDEVAPHRVVEVGLTTGLLERVAERYPEKASYGLDRSSAAIQAATDSASARGVSAIPCIQCDFFDIATWTKAFAGDGAGLIFSLHFHELMARGEAPFVEALRELRSRLPGWTLIAFEQPRMPHTEKAHLSETLWLYAQSNILIHHLIGNGRILTREAWLDLARKAGCPAATDRPCDYLGYRAFRFQL